MKVLKFGGTSVGTAESINKLLNLVKEEKARNNPIVVLSAMSGVTNSLIEMAELAEKGKGYQEILKSIEKRHFEIIKTLLPAAAQNPILTQLKITFNELDDALQAVSSLKELSSRSKDYIVSFGERCSNLMVSHIANQYFKPSLYVDGSQLIKTNHKYGNAKVDFEQSNILIAEFYEQHQNKVLFVTGFIGSTKEGKLTTLGRGGSDYTAAIWGAALNAEEVQIWTDVDGMLTADPNIVKKAFSLDELSYVEAMELSYFGAKVIYPPTMVPAFSKKIPIVIKNTFNPNFVGTYIRSNPRLTNLPIKGISSINQISIINLSGSGMVGKAGFSGRLFSLLSREQINVVLITQSSSEHSITFAVNPADGAKAVALINKEFELELAARKLSFPEVEGNLAVLAIVGENMKRTPGMAGRLFHALGRNGINVRAIAQGSSEYNISVIIKKSDLSKSLNAVHDAFFTSLKQTLNVFCLGTGNIGKTLFEQIHKQADYLAANNDLQVKVIGIINTRKMLLKEGGIALKNWEETLEQEGEQSNLSEFIMQMRNLNLANCVFVDNTASEVPISYYKEVFESSISIVACNKKGNSASYEQYRLFKDTAKKHGVDFHYETNVGAGLPIIRTLKDLMMSGDRISKIESILSGTISFIFNNFTDDKKFHEVVKKAQELGYTEPDPRDDLNGKDFMRKMLILARDAGHQLEAEDVNIRNILPDSCLNANSVEEFYQELKNNNSYFEELKNTAANEKKVLRFIGKLENGKVEIGLQMVDDQHPFFALSGSDNIISFVTDRYRLRPMVVKGPGAGAEVTAAGVFADIINVANR